MSLGSSKIEPAMDNAVTSVVSAGIVAVTAAGNFNEGACAPLVQIYWNVLHHALKYFRCP